mgnify:CR=1 FL=1
MRAITLGVFLEQELHGGGGYQQALNAALLISKLSPALCKQVFITTVYSNVAMLKQCGIEAIYLPMSKWHRLLMKLRKFFLGPYTSQYINAVFGGNYFERVFEQNNVDLVYFTSPSALALDLERLNYIMTVWDLCHRDDPEFPEVRNASMFEHREDLYSRTLTKAIAVIVDSDLGKQNIIRRYGVDDVRVHILPFSPATGTQISEAEYEKNYIDIKSKYQVNEDYIFYPAQFWAHKNHVYILHALKVLEDKTGLRIGAIFSGGDAGGNLEHIKNTADGLGVLDRITFAGFVDNEEIPYLYRQSIALVMPTYFGPTNLPPLEAFSLGVPVLYSDKVGLRDQVADAALLMDLLEPDDLANHLERLMTDKNMCKTLIRKGKKQIELLGLIDDVATLETIIKDFRIRRRCWG